MTQTLTAARPLLDDAARKAPEFRAWLRLLEATFDQMDAEPWRGVQVQRAEARPADSPVLEGAALTVPASGAVGWTERLLRLAGAEAPRLDSASAVSLLQAVISQDAEQIVQASAAAGIEPQTVQTISPLLVAPLLHSVRASVSAAEHAHWKAGYCPVCAAWPALAEQRGLERMRRLRCSRCGADWGMQWLQCVYCSNTEHRTLASLIPEEAAEARHVDVCRHCNGYLKAAASLNEWPPYRVALEDLFTVELDLAALEEGFERPTAPGYILHFRLEAAEEPRRLWGWKR